MEARQDIVLGLALAGLGLAAAWMARGYAGASGTYPMVLGLILTLLGGAVAVRAARSGNRSARALVEAPGKLLVAVGIATLYVAAVVPLGFYTASFLLMLAMPFGLGLRRPLQAGVVAVIFMASVYLVFTVLLEKPLPREAILSILGSPG
ncbi:hypothetical protein RAZWK3B_19796 [Roseobacter sp. AzwK-3b]|uniref:tripartite tricarboxylate transporter TctB family protein n=1 Tax=Roseobacter sp. AzwK-3b TaxID=351016 RepID=UPI000156922B|nr:tripartite tricarboxylate transporter TctB family protein [Roseobacter sp. AzwK-3b]EDM71630.1 hypothetical protein RAZWK3B_19796 [Roseobacter sp. AzwK-3b]